MRKAFESARAALGRAFGLLLALEAMPAVASEITSAVVTVNAPDCQEYTINVCATNLDSNTWYTVDYTFTVIPAAGPR